MGSGGQRDRASVATIQESLIERVPARALNQGVGGRELAKGKSPVGGQDWVVSLAHRATGGGRAGISPAAGLRLHAAAVK